MSSDKHKKRDRAYAFIRSLRSGWQGFSKGQAKATLSGPVSDVVRYCVNRGMATLTRTRPGALHRSRARHNLFDADYGDFST